MSANNSPPSQSDDRKNDARFPRPGCFGVIGIAWIALWLLLTGTQHVSNYGFFEWGLTVGSVVIGVALVWCDLLRKR